jgi:hypothetical protein
MRFPDGIGMIAEAQTSAVWRWAYVARLYPTAGQAASLDVQGQAARVLWNLVHEWYTRGDRYLSIARRPSIAEMDWQIREARAKPLRGWEWLAQLPAQASQQVLKDYVRAWDRCHRGLAKPPRFKKAGRRMAVDVPQASALNITRLNHRWGQLSIPLVGRVRFRWTRPMPGISRDCSGRITGARLIRDRLGWHVSFRIEESVATITANLGPPVGVDRGVIHTMALSNGEMLDMPRYSPRARNSECWGWNARPLASSSLTGRVHQCPHGIVAPLTKSPDCGPSRRGAERTGSTARPLISPRPTASSWWRTAHTQSEPLRPRHRRAPW